MHDRKPVDWKSLYDVLALEAGATSDEVKKRFRQLSKIYHPDGGTGSDEEAFKKINEAYQLLVDPSRTAERAQWYESYQRANLPPRLRFVDQAVSVSRVPVGDITRTVLYVENDGGPLSGTIDTECAPDRDWIEIVPELGADSDDFVLKIELVVRPNDRVPLGVTHFTVLVRYGAGCAQAKVRLEIIGSPAYDPVSASPHGGTWSRTAAPAPRPHAPLPPKSRAKPGVVAVASVTIGAYFVVKLLIGLLASPANAPLLPADPKPMLPIPVVSYGPSQDAQCDPPRAPGVLVGSPPTTDTYIGTAYHRSGSANDETLGFGGWGDEYTVFIRFDVSEGPSPDDVLDVRICLFAAGVPAQDPQLSIHRITEPWVPSGLSTTRRPALVQTDVLGAMTRGWNQFDGSQLYRLWRTWPDSNFGFALRPHSTDQTNGSFAASKHANASLHPRLVFHLRSPIAAMGEEHAASTPLPPRQASDSTLRDTVPQLGIVQLDTLASSRSKESATSTAPAIAPASATGTASERGYTAYAEGRFEDALPLFEQAAAAGDAASAGYLGFMHLKGLGVPVDYSKARALFESSAAAGEAGAAYNLGDMYFNGWGVRESKVTAQRWYRQAFPIYLSDATSGELESMVMVGRMYLEGAGISSDAAQAQSWLGKAAERNHPRAQRILGLAFIDGFRVRRDRAEGIRLLTRAARNGDKLAQERLRSMKLPW